MNRRALRHNFKSTPATGTNKLGQQKSGATPKNNGASAINEVERKRRQASIDAIPKLDIKKAEKYSNLPDPYAYLRDSYQSQEPTDDDEERERS